MPYKNPDEQRKFQRDWVADRRADHFRGKKCARCGKPVNSHNADLDHKKPKRNRDGHKIWSREKKDRSKEIAKTQILCKACHKKKTAADAHRRAQTESVIHQIIRKYTMAIMEDKLPGGKGDDTSVSEFDPKEVKMGLKVESEHTDDKEVALEIVKDHLSENPHYYSELKNSGIKT